MEHGTLKETPPRMGQKVGFLLTPYYSKLCVNFESGSTAVLVNDKRVHLRKLHLRSVIPNFDRTDALVNKMTAATWRFRRACEEDLDRILNDLAKTIRLFAFDFYA